MERVGQGGNTRSLEGRSSGEEENGKIGKGVEGEK